MGLSGYRWAAGHLDAVDLDETYAIERFTRQSDMDAGRQWMRPDNDADVVDLVAEVVEGIDGNLGGYGDAVIKWKLRALTPKMVAYILSSRFPGGAFSYPATIRTFNRASGAFEVYQAIARRKLFRDTAELAAGGYDRWEIEFIEGTLVS